MFRTKVRIHTCKVILLTSLVWFLVDVVVLTFYSDCVGGSGWGCSNVANGNGRPVEHVQALVESTDAAKLGSSSKGRGILYEQLHDRGKEVVHKERYDKSELRRWRPAPKVVEVRGKPGELGKPVHIPADQDALMKEKFKLNQFNLLASDMISLNRSLTDVRLDG